MGVAISQEHNLVLFLNNLSLGIFEIETGDEFFPRLIERVIDFLFIDFRKNIERRHRRRFGYGVCAVILTLPSCASNSKVVLPPPATNVSTVLIDSPCRCSFAAQSLAIFPLALCAPRGNPAPLDTYDEAVPFWS